MIIYTKRESGQAINIRHKPDDYTLAEGEFSADKDEFEITDELVLSLNSDTYNLYVKSQEYARNRASAYDSIGNQLDMMMKDNRDGTTTHQTACEAVKARFPKPA